MSLRIFFIRIFSIGIVDLLGSCLPRTLFVTIPRATIIAGIVGIVIMTYSGVTDSEYRVKLSIATKKEMLSKEKKS